MRPEALKCHFGHADEWEYFYQNLGPVIEPIVKIHDVLLDLLTKTELHSSDDNVVYMLAVGCLKEFEELLLLAGNGYGGGTTKLLRAFYERVVTFHYLATNPAKIEQFMNYTSVHWHKLLMEAEAVHADAGLDNVAIQKIKDDYEAVREQFMEVICKPCDKKRPQMSWTKKPIPQQASELNPTLRALCFNAYLRPTFYLHTTFLGITWQATTDNDEVKLFGTKLEHETAKESLELAHLLLVHATDVTNDYFKLSRDELMKELARDWKDAWDQVRPAKKPEGE
jgi:hypothetical protein